MMNNMFSIPYYFTSIKNWSETKQNILNKFNINNVSLHNNYDHSINTDYYNFQDRNNDVVEIFNSYLTDFIKLNNFNQYKVTDSWIEIAKYSNNHNVHNHGPNGFSAICYVNYNNTIHTPTFFIAPFNNFLNGETILFANKNTTEGDFIIFPSAIHHYTAPNLSDIPRIILSFNFKIL